jgi:hypothetical protein
LDLFTWLSYRCFIAKGEERVPLFGEMGLVSQLGAGISTASEIPGMSGELAGFGEGFVALVSGTD